jgi:hypothetical protein
MAQHNKSVTEVVAWRRKREIKACPESLLELRRRREQRLVRSAPRSLNSVSLLGRVSKRIASVLGIAISMGTNSVCRGGAISVIGLGFRRCTLAQLNPLVAQFGHNATAFRETAIAPLTNPLRHTPRKWAAPRLAVRIWPRRRRLWEAGRTTGRDVCRTYISTASQTTPTRPLEGQR